MIIEEFNQRDRPASNAWCHHRCHAPFTWGKDGSDAVHNAVVMEEIAAMATATRAISPEVAIQPELTDKHYNRKHGKNSYYGQKRRFSMHKLFTHKSYTHKLLALDLDGTVLNSQHTISKELVEAIKQVAQHTHVVIVTGRYHVAAKPYYE